MSAVGWSVLGVAAIAGTVALGWIWRQRAQERHQEDGPTRRDPTAPEDRLRVLQDGILLGVEMCRAEGAIGEAEIEAVRDYLGQQAGLPPEIDAEWIERAINKAIRATITSDVVKATARSVRNRADPADRKIVLGMLIAIATADGALNEREKEWFLGTAWRLGFTEEDATRRWL